MQNDGNNTFDVLLINDNRNSMDIIQSMMEKKCLGTFIDGNVSKLYFIGGTRKKIENQLMNVMPELILQSKWEIQSSKNWHVAWKKYFKPIIIDEKLAVLPFWEKLSLAKINLYIKPGMAFGTGHHESTWLVLNKMLTHVKSGMEILDLGTGSGILSFAAQLLGAGKIDAVENDLDCKENFFENMKLNNISFHHDDVLKWNDFHHDIILANINRNILEALMPNLKNFKGKIILSGLLSSDLNGMKKIIEKHGLFIKEFSEKEDWLCLVLMSNE
jgi:ribosomal protein L11 methyltransferase